MAPDALATLIPMVAIELGILAALGWIWRKGHRR